MNFIRIELEEKYIEMLSLEKSVLLLVYILKVVIFPVEADLFILSMNLEN